jgi:hypothetical protein
MRLLLLTIILTVHSLGNNAIAQKSSSLNAKLLFDFGIHYGGDDIATVQFQNGDEQEMLAGQGLTLAVGGQFGLTNFKYAFVRTSIGFKYSTTAADNANIMFLRYPFNLMAYAVPFKDALIGIGTTSHIGAILKGDGFFDDVEYDSSFGPRFEIGYKGAAIVYSSVNFTDDSGNEFDGSAFGLSYSFTLPR